MSGGSRTVEHKAGDLLGGRFRFDRIVGKGGMGAVMAATDTETGRQVALKVMRSAVARDPTAVERFKREGEVLRAIDHPAVVGVEDVGMLDDGTLYLALELLEGRTLKERIHEDGPVPPALLVPVVHGLCEALEAVHQAGVVHRDIKPSNIFLPDLVEVERASIGGDAVLVKLVDFGVAKVWGSAELTGTGLAVGTARYMAPEQLSARPDIDRRADVYSVAVVIYEALTGTQPFGGVEKKNLLGAVLAGETAPLLDVSPELGPVIAAVVGKGMARERELRFATARELADAFAAAVHRPELVSIPPQPAFVPVRGDDRQTVPEGPAAAAQQTRPARPARMPSSQPPPPPSYGIKGRTLGLVVASSVGLLGVLGALVYALYG